MSVTIARRAAEDDQELFRLHGEVFGQGFSESSRRRWDWQYLENPETGPQGPTIWIARDGQVLLGQYASMPVRLWWGDQHVQASWGMDVFVRSEARGRGVGALLFNAWADHVDVALGLGLTPSSYGLFKKLGYRDVGPVPFYRKDLDPRAVAVRRLGGFWGRIAAGPLGLVLGLLYPEHAHQSPAGLTDVRTIESFSREYDELWERARSSYAMCVCRNAAYLNWKYARCPHRRYQLWEARQAGRLTGYAVTRHEDYRGLRLGWIVDLFADSADAVTRNALLATTLAAFHQAGAARIQAFSLNAALGRALRSWGFRPSRSPMQFCVHTRQDRPDVLADLGRWHVVFGDSDMDR